MVTSSRGLRASVAAARRLEGSKSQRSIEMGALVSLRPWDVLLVSWDRKDVLLRDWNGVSQAVVHWEHVTSLLPMIPAGVAGCRWSVLCLSGVLTCPSGVLVVLLFCRDARLGLRKDCFNKNKSNSVKFSSDMAAVFILLCTCGCAHTSHITPQGH